MKKPKMYIPVLEPGKSVSLICANKVTGLEEYLPTQEMLNIHMEQQKNHDTEGQGLQGTSSISFRGEGRIR